VILTYRYRIKDGASATKNALNKQAAAVNIVWNYCCQIDRESRARWESGCPVNRPSAFDLIKLCVGVARDLGLHSDCVSAVCQKFENARHDTFPNTPSFRSYKRNLGWIPVTRFIRAAKFEGGELTFLKCKYRVWNSRPLPDDGTPKSWNFSADARGRWYLNIQVELSDVEPRKVQSAVGIDLGLKDLATLSTGEKIKAPTFYRKAEQELARLQRFGMKSRARTMAAKVANQRKHFLHVASSRLVTAHDRIFVGDVNASSLKKTKMAKSVSDAGWSMFRKMLSYKAIALGGKCEVVSEKYTSQTCSCCGTIPVSSPKGMGALGIRRWECCDCGASHDRDVNAAHNILRVGLERQAPAGGIPVL
jgi:putative transposase